ncbi:hypothetical protein [Aquisphaera insulae]|uniref:hypothetical protein n=1 Tax=Aquisphaera insulae TaxID=2712864 RepID=UPI0013EE2347|nr:hypothetical protein [Aquisphaera insulae]
MTRSDTTTSTGNSRWKRKRTDETRDVENALREAGFRNSDAYRYNSASIRVRVIDEKFEGKSIAKRDAMVERVLKNLPEHTQADIITLLTFAPSELGDDTKALRERLLNSEFEDPSPSTL